LASLTPSADAPTISDVDDDFRGEGFARLGVFLTVKLFEIIGLLLLVNLLIAIMSNSL
jgi:hypothetical protein